MYINISSFKPFSLFFVIYINFIIIIIIIVIVFLYFVHFVLLLNVKIYKRCTAQSRMKVVFHHFMSVLVRRVAVAVLCAQ